MELDYGFVGDVVDVNSTLFTSLLETGLIPVLCAITHNKKGQLLNTNADTIAAEIAKALSSAYNVTLFYCFEHAGVLHNVEDPNSIMGTLTQSQMDTYIKQDIIHKGMIPKLHNGFDALKNGVKKVVISNTVALSDTNAPKTTLI